MLGPSHAAPQMLCLCCLTMAVEYYKHATGTSLPLAERSHSTWPKCACRPPRSWVLPEVREFIRDATPKTNTTRGGRRARHPKTTLPHRPPGPPAAGRIVGGAPAGTRPLRGWLIPRVPYSGLVPYGDQTAVLPTRPREGDVCENGLEPRRGLRLHAQGYRRGPLGRM